MSKRVRRAAAGYHVYHGSRRGRGRGLLLLPLILVLLAAGLWAYARWGEPRMLRVERLTVQDARAERSLCMVVLSDLHIGRECDADRVARVMRQTVALDPEVVLFLGDLFDDYSAYRDGEEARLTALLSLADLPDARKIAVWGNHDYGGGAEQAYARMLENAGWTLLCNEAVELDGGFRLIGADDAVWGHPDVQELIADGACNILLCHEPDFGDSVRGAALQLSGHTHGLQIDPLLPSLRARVAPYGGEHYLGGRYEKPDGSVVYVSRGIGLSLYNYRLFAPPEVTLVEVRP